MPGTYLEIGEDLQTLPALQQEPACVAQQTSSWCSMSLLAGANNAKFMSNTFVLDKLGWKGSRSVRDEHAELGCQYGAESLQQ